MNEQLEYAWTSWNYADYLTIEVSGQAADGRIDVVLSFPT